MSKEQWVTDVELKNCYCEKQMREEIPDIEYLAGSIKAVGQINPITVKQVGMKYKVIAGERRFRAFQHLRQKALEANAASKEWARIEVKVVPGSDKELEALQLQENVQQRQPSTMEYFRIIDAKAKAGMSNEDIAKELFISPSWVTQLLNVRNASEKVKEAVTEGAVSVNKAIALGKSGLDEKTQNKLVPVAQKQTDKQFLDSVKKTQVKKGIAPKDTKTIDYYEFISRKKAKPVIDDLLAKVRAKKNRENAEYLRGVQETLKALVVLDV